MNRDRDRKFRHGPRDRRPPLHARKPAGPGAQTSWEHVAAWYDKLIGDGGSDYHRNVLIPSALRLLDVKAGESVLDLCCGQGVLARAVAAAGAGQVVGVDVSGSLIQAARTRGGQGNLRYVEGDARRADLLPAGSFDAAACLMAVHDVDDVAALFGTMASALRAGGRGVIVMMHPCFRIPRQSSWGWDEQVKIQYRRIDRYASPIAIPIATHPGSRPGESTMFFHRPLADYLNALAAAGLLVAGCEELLSHHRSDPGGRSRAENRAREEFPLFLAIKVTRASRP